MDGHKLYLFGKGELEELLIRFARMSKKHDQQQTIEEIRRVLKRIGEAGFC
ncbi:hypothetical protein JXA12_04820 [Candidatus Woesearchaeota archaeon]|nr:hypothetical protein [Candidatus Woesearchaeota archaeon]